MAFPASGMFVTTWRDAIGATQLALDLSLSTHKVALFTNALTGADLTTDTAYGVGAWAANEIPNGSGYTTGGALVSTPTWTHTGTGVVSYGLANTAWSSATFSGVRGCLIYADALAGNNGIVAVNFGADYQVTSGTLTIQWNGGIVLTIDFIP